MLNLTIKIRPHLQKSSHLDFSPKIAIFALSCKEIRRRRRRNGQAGARPCKRTVGDAGIGTGKASQTADIHQSYKCAGAPLSAQRSLFRGSFFCRPSGRGGAGYHHFAKVSTDSPNRKRKASRRKLLGGKKVGRDDLGFRKQDCHLFSPQYIVLLRFTPQ